MTEDSSQERRPFGSRKDGEQQQPFGSRGAYRRRQQRRPRRQSHPPTNLIRWKPTPTPRRQKSKNQSMNLAAYEPAPYEDDVLEHIEPEDPLFDVDMLEEAIRADQAVLKFLEGCFGFLCNLSRSRITADMANSTIDIKEETKGFHLNERAQFSLSILPKHAVPFGVCGFRREYRLLEGVANIR